MPRKTIILVLAMFLLMLIVGCGSGSNDLAPGDPGEEETLGYHIMRLPMVHENVGGLLSSVGKVKFGEIAEVGPKMFNTTSAIQSYQGLVELYRPGATKQGLELSAVKVYHSDTAGEVNTINILNQLYDDAVTGDYAYFSWAHYIPPENATRDFFGRGASEEYMEERNGVEYAVSEWVKRDTQEPDGFLIAWTQHNQVFTASLPASHTLDEALAFCDAQPVEAWELLGDAVSVSVQGMEGISIFGEGGAEVAVVGDELYMPAEGGGMERVGYMWLIDSESSRYQYVLGPGEYAFAAESVKKGAGLLVRHFESGEAVSSTDYAKALAGQSARQLYLEVTADPGDTAWTDNIPTSLSTR